MIIKPPKRQHTFGKRVFLAGSIEMGMAEDWQAKVGAGLDKSTVCIYNPRRDQWDASWEQDISNPQFKEQVVWELDNLEISQVKLFYFDPNTKAPITLMELGLAAAEYNADWKPDLEHMIVCCPKGYWRKGNVDIVCERFAIQQVATLDDLIIEGKKHLN